MKDEENIRNTTENDFEDIFAIMNDMLLLHMSPQKIDSIKEDMRQEFLKIIHDTDAIFMTMERNGEIIGFVNGSPPPATWNVPEHKTFIIEEIATRQDVRSTGVGGRLLQFLEGHLRKKGYKKIAASSNIARKRAHEFYVKNNFEKDEFRFSKNLVEDD